MGNVVGFIGDAIISTNPAPSSTLPRTMTMMSFTEAFDPYNSPETVVIDYVYAYKNGNITTYNITSTNVTYTDTKFLIKVDDGTNYIVLNQNIATEFGIIPGVENRNFRELTPRTTTWITGVPMTNFSLAQYANDTAYMFSEGNETYGFGVMMNPTQTGYTLCNFTNMAYNDVSLKYTGQINGSSFTADIGEYFTGFIGLGYVEQYDSMAGFKGWFQISNSKWLLITVVIIIILIILILALAWGFGWFKTTK